MPPNEELTIAIPTFNNFDQLKYCLYTLTAWTEYPYKIVVINNGAAADPDGRSFEDQLRVVITYPNLKVIQAECNLGWQRAINRAFLEECESPYFCMMNDDVFFLPFDRHFWQRMNQLMTHPEVGGVGPCSNYVSGAQHLMAPRGGLIFETTYLIGLLYMTRSELFSEIGGLDESLPGGDDLDYSILVRALGYKLLVNKSCYVHHIGQQTGLRVNKEWNSLNYCDLVQNSLMRKHGVREVVKTYKNEIQPYRAITQTTDYEGDQIRTMIEGLECGLDIGCGANKTVERAIGIDNRNGSSDAGGTKGIGTVAEMVADASKIPLPDGSQDFIVARHVLEHIIDSVKALKEWKRLLRHNGMLCIAIPDENLVRSITYDWTHVHAWNAAALARLLETCGFNVERLVPVSNPGFSLIVMARNREPAFSPATYEMKYVS